MKHEVINIDGKKANEVELSDKIFSLQINKKIISSILDWQLNHFKPRVAKTKQRNEITGSTAKIAYPLGLTTDGTNLYLVNNLYHLFVKR